MHSRRDFLRNTCLLPFAPAFGACAANAARRDADAPRASHGRILVVVELNGGNDGVNTVVPHRDPGYEQLRSALRLPRTELFALDDELGLHPSLRGFKELFDAGQLAVVQGAGYPEPNLSHDTSMAIWHTARRDRAGRTGTGWIGRVFDRDDPHTSSMPGAVLVGPHAPPAALRGRRFTAAAVPTIEEFLAAGDLAERMLPASDAGSPLGRHLDRTIASTRTTTAALRRVVDSAPASTAYPDGKLAHDLRLASSLIRAGFDASVYYAIQTGYDTHSLQLEPHARRLQELGDSLVAFFTDLRDARLDERVTVLVFSEFGRRAAENASRGTDHGTSGPVFLAGPGVRGGVFGRTPSLSDLVDDNLTMSVDFRRIYAAVLRDWLARDPVAVLGDGFEPLALFA
ncbi:MAG: DUF1501 domain-containing protein [Planctomycetes bacterium]|nr:DUF1501 domain-containing protein [Planctomycetota bacterium]